MSDSKLNLDEKLSPIKEDILEDNILKDKEKNDSYERDLERIREFHKLLSSDSSSDESDKDNDSYSDLKSNENSNTKTGANVGTSNKSSNSFRNLKQLVNNKSPILSENEVRKPKRLKEKPQENIEENHDMENIDLDSISIRTESYEINLLNMNETLALIESDEEHDKHEAPKDDDLSLKSNENQMNKLKRAVVTILLTNKWQQNKKRHPKKPKSLIKYQPTFRIEPKDDFKTVKYLIVKKLKQTFESLVEKHGKYDVEYTPRFLRIITEMLKNDAKSFKLDRYKIVVQVTILQKVLEQAILFISRELFNIDDDHKISLRMDTITFNAVALIFFVYHE